MSNDSGRRFHSSILLNFYTTSPGFYFEKNFWLCFGDSCKVSKLGLWPNSKIRFLSFNTVAAGRFPANTYMHKTCRLLFKTHIYRKSCILLNRSLNRYKEYNLNRQEMRWHLNVHLYTIYSNTTNCAIILKTLNNCLPLNLKKEILEISHM